MAAKKNSSHRTAYVCQTCGTQSPRWMGRCPGCEEWNTLVEERVQDSAAAGGPHGGGSADAIALSDVKWVTFGGPDDADANPSEGAPGRGDGTSTRTSVERAEARLKTGIGELDRVLGGGLVPDGFVLVGGDPGIGKSTLLLQMAEGLTAKDPDAKVLYMSGEESIEQIRGRAQRLGVRPAGRLAVAAENRLESALALVAEVRPKVLIIDSLQTFVSADLESAPGSVSQMREIAARLMDLAKRRGIAVWIVGHVTKEGNIAGPKVVEHMVDTVLYFEGDAGLNFRILRSVKNRFGSVREIGVFEMDGEGLKEVPNPSALFLSGRREGAAGTAVGASLEGTRTILVELQGLVIGSPLAMPRRTAVGIDTARIALLAAILERHLGVSLAQRDLFFNVAGGIKLVEPACDLAAAVAIWSSAEGIVIPSDTVFIGELGLTGEVRRVSQIVPRIEEARKLGFRRAVVPKAGLEKLPKNLGVELIPLATVRELRGALGATAPAVASKPVAGAMASRSPETAGGRA